LAALAGLAVGLSVAAAFVVTRPDREDVADIPHEEAASLFVDAWERSRTEELVVLSTFHRRTALGGEMETPQELVQRPPDFIVRQFGDVDGRIGDKPVRCTPESAGSEKYSCDVVDAELKPYDEKIAEEVATLESYFVEVDGHPLYRVTTDGEGCFDLTLTRLYPAPPYGEFARVCFDEKTGARIYEEVRKKEGTDITEAVEIRTDVRDADFRLE
jgi:hypothetical protein